MKSQLAWSDDKILRDFIAAELHKGRILLCLGAGVSRFYGAPNWSTLIDLVAKVAPRPYTPGGHNAPVEAERLLLDGFGGNVVDFRKAIHSALYKNAKGLDAIVENRALRAFGALVGQSLRGKVATILTLNYDDLVERYLRFHGHVVQSVVGQHFLTSSADAVIYHPHGFLPEKIDAADFAREIVITRSDYNRVLSDEWQEVMRRAFATHLVLYIGLSGDDDRMSQLIDSARPANPYIATHGMPYFGIRLCSQGDSMKSVWENAGIFCVELSDLDSGIPDFLFGICQLAANKLGDPND